MHVLEAIHDRFDQPGYRTYRNLEELVLKACKGENYNAELDFVYEFYKEYLSKAQLQAQLPLLQPLCETEGSNEIIIIHNVLRILSGLSSAVSGIFISVDRHEANTDDACYQCLI